MEKRGIRTDKGEINRQIAADNKLLKEIKARITRLYNWSKAEAEKPEDRQPSMIDLWEAQQQLKRPDNPAPARYGLCRRAPPCSAFCRQTASSPCSSSMKKIADMKYLPTMTCGERSLRPSAESLFSLSVGR